MKPDLAQGVRARHPCSHGSGFRGRPFVTIGANTMTLPVFPMKLWMQMGRIALESQTVIVMRMAGMMGIIAQSPGEPFRMIAEKQAAAAEAANAVFRASLRGQSYERVLAAGLRPYGRRTRANSRRLSRPKQT